MPLFARKLSQVSPNELSKIPFTVYFLHGFPLKSQPSAGSVESSGTSSVFARVARRQTAAKVNPLIHSHRRPKTASPSSRRGLVFSGASLPVSEVLSGSWQSIKDEERVQPARIVRKVSGASWALDDASHQFAPREISLQSTFILIWARFVLRQLD